MARLSLGITRKACFAWGRTGGDQDAIAVPRDKGLIGGLNGSTRAGIGENIVGSDWKNYFAERRAGGRHRPGGVWPCWPRVSSGWPGSWVAPRLSHDQVQAGPNMSEGRCDRPLAPVINVRVGHQTATAAAGDDGHGAAAPDKRVRNDRRNKGSPGSPCRHRSENRLRQGDPSASGKSGH